MCRKGAGGPTHTVGERPKVKRRICAMELENAEAGVCMHERKLALDTKIRGLCGCKRGIEIILHYKKRIQIFEEFIIVF